QSPTACQCPRLTGFPYTTRFRSFDHYLVTREFPLVPYARLGFDYAYWQITDGNGEIANDGNGGHGRGATPGWHGAVGLALVIDRSEEHTSELQSPDHLVCGPLRE